jgi:hypothetical protein
VIRSQSLIPLTSGAYRSRNKIGVDSICENTFPELNPDDTTPSTPTTHYMREGLVALSAPPTPGAGRGVFTLSTGQMIAAVGNTVYSISNSWVWTALGTISDLSTPVKVADNGQEALLVDGTNIGYQIVMSPLSMAPVSDPTGTFVGSVNVDFSDTFIAFSPPNTNQWGVTNPNSITFNIFQMAGKDSKPDPIVTLAFNQRVAWLLGALTSEVWFDAGATPFPYQEWPNIFVPYGCAAPYSLVRADVSLFWLSRNDQGQAIAVTTEGYAAIAFSTRALEFEWSTYPTVSDCIAGTFQQAGHIFIIFHFPSADKTWAYDLSTKQWHARIYIDSNGQRHREKVSFYASATPQGGFPTAIVGQDWSTGHIYQMTPNAFDDNGRPIVCRRSFPHQIQDLKEISPTQFVVDFEAGAAPNLPASGIPGGSDFNGDFNNDFGPGPGGVAFVPAGPALCMRYSKDGGNTWSNYRQKSLNSGDYRGLNRYRGLGMGRDWLFEVLWVYPGKCALQGAYIPAPIVHGA